MQQVIKSTENTEKIPLMKKGQTNSYRPDDIKRWGIHRFLNTVAAKEPFIMPNFGFTEEENKRMDEIILEEKENNDL